MSRLLRRRSTVRPLAALFAPLLCLGGVASQTLQSQQPARTVAVGDVHGDPDQLLLVLRDAGLVDQSSGWTGGDARLVLTGDLIDRGPRSRDVLDLVRRLQLEAPGRVQALLGNHEAMNLMGDLRYVPVGEYAEWTSSRSEALREDRWGSWVAFGKARAARLGFAEPAAGEVEKKAWMEAHPPGFFERRRAFGPEGEYGRWLRGLAAARLDQGVAFVHGGFAPAHPYASVEALNEQVRREIEDLDRIRESLARAGVLWDDLVWGESLGLLREELTVWEAVDSLPPDRVDPEALRGRPSDETLDRVRRLLGWQTWAIGAPDGPLWYRGLASEPEEGLASHVEDLLRRYGARQVVVGHTVMDDGRVHARFGGSVFAIDTGMSSAVSGRAAALEIRDGRFTALYPGEEPEALWGPEGAGTADGKREEAPAHEPSKNGDALLGLSLERIEEFLRKAAISEVRKLATGITKPSRATLDDGTLRHDVAIQTVDRCEDEPRRGGRRERECDSYRYNLAAYEINKLLGLRSIPPSVEREFDGRAAAFTWWIDGAMTFADMKAQGRSPPDGEAWNKQQFVVGVFDELIYNTDRNQGNLLVDPSWRIWMIDHTRAFRTASGLRNQTLLGRMRADAELLSRLRALDVAALESCCGEWLSSRERKALLARRDSILTRFP